MGSGLYHIILITGILSVLNPCNSQDRDIAASDSLKNRLSVETDEQEKADLLKKLFWHYRRVNIDSAADYAGRWLDHSKRTGDLQGTAESLYGYGVICKIKGDYGKAVDFFNEARINYEKAGSATGIISCITESASINIRQGNYDQALMDLHAAQEYYHDSIPDEKIARIYNMLGSIYQSLEQYDKSLEYHEKSLEINQRNNFELGISVNYNNIGNAYRDLKMIPQAIDSYIESLKIKEKIGDKVGTASSLNNLGLAWLELGNHSKAIETHKTCLKLNREIGDRQGISMCLVNLGLDYLTAGDYIKAIEYSKQGLDLSTESGLIENISEAYGTLSKASAALGNYRDAYRYHLEYMKYSDSLTNDRVMEKIARLENRYAMEKKEKEIALLNVDREKQEVNLQKQKTIRNLMAATVVLALISLAMIWSRFRHRQKINRQLREINESKSRFFANISHEFRTPLTLLAGPLETLLEKESDNDRQLLRMMYRNVNRLLLLNNQLMDLSRLESGTLRLKLGKGKIIQALRGMATSFDSLAQQRNITYKLLFPEEEIICLFDLDKLEKIVYNLLSNAFKFTPDKGRIVFEVRHISDRKANANQEGSLEINVSDTGKGISPEHLPRIFDRFYQADNNLNREYEGTGLGLAITRELVEVHMGKISVKNNPDRGTLFTVILPLNRDAYPAGSFSLKEYQDEACSDESLFNQEGDLTEEAKEPVLQDLLTGVKNTEKPLILIVEDNPDMRSFIRTSLGDGFSFIDAPDGEKGYGKAIESIPELVITDLMMPRTDGVQLCEKLKSDERTSHIPVIMLTALATVEHRIKGLETGADDYLTKPFNREELKTRCNNLIEQRRKLREKYRQGLLLEPKEISVTSVDERFLNKLINTLENHISNPELDVDLLIREVGMSRSQLHKKLKALTGLSTTEFVRNFRLKRAATLLKGNYGNVADVCYAVGFNSLSYFTRCFHEMFGVAPSAYK